MGGLLPNTKELEQRLEEIGNEVKNMADRMVNAQEKIVEQNGLILDVLVAIKERLDEQNQEVSLLDAISDQFATRIRIDPNSTGSPPTWMVAKDIIEVTNQGIPSPFITPPTYTSSEERGHQGSGVGKLLRDITSAPFIPDKKEDGDEGTLVS